MTTRSDRLSSRDRALACLLGLHGLILLVVFPLGPQEARLWQPGIPGVAALAAAFPLAAVLGGLLGLRAPALPTRIATLAFFAFLTTLPSFLATSYDSFFAGRIISGVATGIGLVALHKLIPADRKQAISRFATRFFTFGMPACILAATLLDWRAAFALILGAQALVGIFTRRYNPPPPESLDAGRPIALTATTGWVLVAAASLAFITAAYLTILSGFLLLNAGHHELHIPVGLLAGALLGLGVPSLLTRLHPYLRPATRFTSTLAASSLSLAGLLLLSKPLPAVAAIGLIGVFLALSTARQIALGELVASRVSSLDLLTRQSLQNYSPLAHHFGAGLGAFCAGGVIHLTPEGRLGGMSWLLGCGLAATGLAAVAVGYPRALGAAQTSPKEAHNASPAARAAAANNPLRVATSFARSVLTSNTRTPGSPT